MKQVLIIGSGISGMACALRCAEHGIHAELVSPYPSERAQSVMAAGGINAVLHAEDGDSVECHIRDTLKGGAMLGGEQAVTGLCTAAQEIIRYLERIGTVFSLDAAGKPARRAFGGQSFRRTYFCGASTGKQIVSAMVMEVRRFEAAGLIRRRLKQLYRACAHSSKKAILVCLYGEKPNRNVYRSVCFSETTELPFAGECLPVPSGYREILEARYGRNYMTLPPPCRRRRSHRLSWLDPDRAYTQQDRQEILQLLRERSLLARAPEPYNDETRKN